jgi:hypothetical protein
MDAMESRQREHEGVLKELRDGVSVIRIDLAVVREKIVGRK